MSGIFGDGFSKDTAGWKPDPSHRGTYNILSTCFVTLGLCIWTAIHLNIPEYRGSWRRQVWRKLGWMVLGFIAPELVAFTAFQQYRAAKGLTESMKFHFPVPVDRKRTRQKEGTELDVEFTCNSSTPTIHKRRHPWTMIHSYFAVMGGFAVQISDEELNFFPLKADGKERHKRLSLSPDALLYLEEHLPGIVPDLSRSFIEDKSKGSILAKSIVCFQAIWFCIQCLSRVAQGLAVSLLELNTFGHAICTVLIYSLWWNKPLDIEEPEVIMINPKDDKFCMIIAHMCKVSKVDPHPPYREDRTRFHLTIDTISAVRQKKPYPDVWAIFRRTAQAFDRLWDSLVSDRQPSVDLYLTISLSPHLTPSSLSTPLFTTTPILIPLSKSHRGSYTSPGLLTVTLTPGIDLHTLGPLPHRPHISIPPLDLRRWTLSQLAHIHIPSKPHPDSLHSRLRNFPRFTGVSNEWPLYIGLGLSGFIYGGLHCLAWSADFPTRAERVLWRLSSVTVTSTGGLVAVVFTWELFSPFWKGDPLGGFWMAASMLLFGAGVVERWYTCKSGRGERGKWGLVRGFGRGVVGVPLAVVAYGPGVVSFGLKFAFDLVVPVLVVLYVVARVYLVVESFINLSHLPESAYEVPRWSLYVPHIG
ncbi:hypothetical protein QBC34DRAFT_437265 [Podospora aff. communis PSN243]|uniref:Uncharacterized protein n=1 Tax=Podospora aff. communis PSN243 TaxID=3040156 RepID=A0AAV9GV34_9PEZI|nr:hypothetical protein QBC34DRAFT_437265 [Podospora aff. communis PSN243]